jgi:hypothetical protein
MGILEQTIKMKEEGIPEEEIIDELSRQGISPREIDDTLRQAQIKSAVSNQDENAESQPSVMSDRVPSPNDTYQPSYDNQQQQGYAQQQEEYAPVPQEQYAQLPQEQYPQIQEQQYYQPGGNEGYSSSGIDTDTIMEIADQIFSDKIKNTLKLLDATSEAAIMLQTKMENISERVKKIENTIDKLQIAILEKVGSYGNNLESIKKEMSMMQDSFSKMISPSRRTERIEKQLEEISEGEEPKRKVSRKK